MIRDRFFGGGKVSKVCPFTVIPPPL